MPLYIPGELVDTIIGMIPSGDKATLCNCALVCREWLPASRTRLLEDIQITHEWTYELFTSRVLKSQDLKPYLAYTRSLLVEWYRYQPVQVHRYASQTTSSPPDLTCRGPSRMFFYDFSGIMRGLRSLTLRNLCRDKPVCTWEASLTSRFLSLTHLWLEHCLFQSFAYLRSMLAASPSLVNLTLIGVTWPDVASPGSPPPYPTTPTTPAAPVRHPHLSSLRLDFEPRHDEQIVRPLLTWLLTTSPGSSIQTLRFCREVQGGFHRPALPAYELEFLETVAPHVSTLTICPEDLAEFSLTNFVKLESLSLKLNETGYRGKWGTLCGILHDCPYTVHTVHIGPVYTEDAHDERPGLGCPCLHVEDPGLESLDITLTLDTLKRLRDLHIYMVVYLSPGEQTRISQTLARRLPVLHAKNMVTVDLEPVYI